MLLLMLLPLLLLLLLNTITTTTLKPLESLPKKRIVWRAEPVSFFWRRNKNWNGRWTVTWIGYAKQVRRLFLIKKRNFHENRKIRARRRNFTIFSSESNEKAVISASIFGVIIRHTCTRTYIYLHFNVTLDVPFPNFPIYLLHLNWSLVYTKPKCFSKPCPCIAMLASSQQDHLILEQHSK